MTTNNLLTDYLNSPEAKRLQEALEESRLEYEESVDEFWEGLSYEDREKAFYHVCKNIHRGDVLEGRSYRGVLYDVFGFDQGSYAIGMDCGYLTIHNLLGCGIEYGEMARVKSIKLNNTTIDLGEFEVFKFKLLEDKKHLEITVDNIKDKFNININV